MREARMTFGEHLEELRLRVILSLLYFTAGVVITFVNGDTLLKWVLRPHEQAFAGAERSRSIQRMDRDLTALEPLMTNQLTEATYRGIELVPAGFHWEVFFPEIITKMRMQELLDGPYEDLQKEIARLTSIAPGERKILADALEATGHAVAVGLIGQMALGVQFAEGAALPARFRRLESKLREYRELDESGGGSLKRAVGWGADTLPLLERLVAFNGFLDQRKAEVAQSPATIAELRQWTRDLTLVDGLENLVASLERSIESLTRREPKPILVIEYTEHFTAYLKIAMILGLFLAVPFILYEMWKFVGAGLHLSEQKYVVTFMPFSIVLFLCGSLFGFFVMIPVGLEFLASWGSTDIDMNFRLGSYVSLFMTLTLILGVVFQTPLIMVFLYKIGVIDVGVYRRARRIAIFGGVCLAVVLTPPDPFSWFLMALPMIFLYELGILVCQFLGRKSSSVEDSDSQ